MRFVIAIAASLLAATVSHAEPKSSPSRIQKIMAKRDGLTAATAFKVTSVADEYAIAKAMNLKVQSQELILDKKPYDVLTVEDGAGETRQIWFDISSFYGKF